MSESQACVTCGAAVENPAFSGMVCEACYDEQMNPKAGWKEYVGGPTFVGGIAALLPFFLTINLNGVRYVALVAGPIALALGVVGVLLGLKKGAAGRKSLLGAGVVALLGAWHVFASGFWLMF